LEIGGFDALSFRIRGLSHRLMCPDSMTVWKCFYQQALSISEW